MINWSGVLASGLVAGLAVLIGLRYFHATEQTFADII
jgi:hypothetical protein